MKTIVDGLAVEYDDCGSGPAIVMLHGWKDNLRTFDGVTGLLSDSFRVIRVDLPGFGRSDAPPADWALDDYIEFVKDFLAKLNAGPNVFLIGHSFGGRIIIKGVATQILDARKIILISSAGVARRKTLKRFILAALAKIGRIIASIPPISLWKQKLRRKLYEALGSDYFRAGELGGTFVNIIAEDLSAVAGNIKVPAQIIWGAEDDTTPIEEGKRLNRLIHGSEFRVIDGAGHFVHKERPEEVAKLIRGFLT